MRIVLTTDTIGGVWTFTCELTQQLLQAGHAVALVSFGRAPDSRHSGWCGHMDANYGSNFLFRSSTAPLEWMQENTTAFSSGAGLLLRTATEFHADLLHANQFCWGALPSDLPRVITAHSDVLSWATYCRPEELPNSAWLMHYCRLVQRGIDHANVIVAPTDWMRGAFGNGFQVTCEFTVIHNGRTITPATITSERRLRAVSVGRLWDEAKGIQTLINLDSAIPILVAGESCFQQESIATGDIRAFGQLQESAVFDLFRSSSVYIASSIYEPFGLAPLEAALCGCAVIARDLPSLREVWSDDALFYRTREELAALLRKFANDPKALQIAQRRAQARAQRFTAARMAGKYIALYESLVRPRPASHSSSQEPASHSSSQEFVAHAA